jgi:hypothetical protein
MAVNADGTFSSNQESGSGSVYGSFFSKLALVVVLTAFLFIVLLRYCIRLRTLALQNQLLGTAKRSGTGPGPAHPFASPSSQPRPTTQPFSLSGSSSPSERVRLLNHQNVGLHLPHDSTGKQFYSKRWHEAGWTEKVNFWFFYLTQWALIFCTQKGRWANWEEVCWMDV